MPIGVRSWQVSRAGVPARLFALLGKGDVVQSLCSNLQVDISKVRNLLGWECRLCL